MKRAKLNTEEVLYIVVGSTMTAPDETFTDIEGMHFYIDRDGVVSTPVAEDERGNYLPRYAHTSIVIIVEGGITVDGVPRASAYHKNQLLSVKGISESMLRLYPEANVTLWRDHMLGINPVFDLNDLSNLT